MSITADFCRCASISNFSKYESGTKFFIENISDIRVFNATQTFNKSCLSTTLVNSDLIGSDEVQKCALGQAEDTVEEAIPYIAGNTLWAFYQFTVFIVLLSILRARMVNTYHRIFKEADVQWKFFR